VEERVEVAIVGGGPAGAALATRLAAAGLEVACFERAPRPRWRASGVYSSPRTRRGLLELGLSPETVARLCRPIAAMEIESLRGTRLRLDYPAPDHAVGLDRVRLERALLDRAAQAGAAVHEGATVRDVALHERGSGARLAVSDPDGTRVWRARTVVGADGPRSLVARRAGVSRAVVLRRAGVTVHRPDPDASPPGAAMSARMIVGQGWYCGIAPVPGDRVNVGIVLPAGRFRRDVRAAGGPQALVERIVAGLPPPVEAWRGCPDADGVRVALPLAHRVTRSAGPGWLLVGDATGFLDPLSGEGIHRALASAELAAEALATPGPRAAAAWAAYDRELRRRFRPKDLVSWLLQLFMSRPLLFDYAVRRLARRPGLAHTFGLVMADLEPAGRALDPRFLAQLLAP
jgi:flavin-dependent dehydrogenase